MNDDDDNTSKSMDELPLLVKKPPAPLGLSLQRAIAVLKDTGRYSLLAIIVMTLVRGILPAVQVAAIGSLVANIADFSSGLNQAALWALTQLSLAFIGAYVLENLIKYVGDRLTLKLSYDTDITVVRKLSSLEVQDFECAHTYDSIQRVDSTTGQHIFELFDSARSGIQGAISIVSIIAVIATWNLWIAVALLIAPIPAAIATFQLQNKAYEIDFARAPQLRLATYFRELLTSDSIRKEIGVFSLAQLFESRYTSIRKGFLKQDYLLARYNLTKSGTLGLISVFANVASIVFASIVAVQDGKVGELAGFISAMGQMNGLVLATFIGITGIYHNLLYVSNWVAVMEMQPAQISSGRLTLEESKLPQNASDAVEIEFKNVSFTYPGTQTKVLDGVSFKIDAGTTSALVGLNGSGKTTICKLLLRFYEPTSGSILINGTDIADYSREALYKRFSALFQDFAKFERSLGDNITFGAGRGFTDDDAQAATAALNMVALNYLKEELPQGFDTILGRRFDGGQQLSIGQWQRLATARALYKKPGLLVLDEPTASVDAVSEKAMFEALTAIDYQLTILLVAHRFTTICHAEKIIVLDGGKVVGCGDHATLLKSCKFYADMFHAQNSYN